MHLLACLPLIIWIIKCVHVCFCSRKGQPGKNKKHPLSSKAATTDSKAKAQTKTKPDVITPNEQSLINYYKKHNPDNAHLPKVRKFVFKYKDNLEKVRANNSLMYPKKQTQTNKLHLTPADVSHTTPKVWRLTGFEQYAFDDHPT